jgi:hypothetical protein
MAKEAGNLEYCPTKDSMMFLQMIREIEENGEHERQFSGSLGYPGFIQAIYRGKVQMGFEDEKK